MSAPILSLPGNGASSGNPLYMWFNGAWTTTTSNSTLNYANGQLNFVTPTTTTISTNGGHSLTLNDTGNMSSDLSKPSEKIEATKTVSGTYIPMTGAEPATDHLKKINDLEKKVKALESENKQFEEAIKGYESSNDKLNERLENQTHNYQELQEAHDALRSVLNTNTDTWEEYDQRIEELESKLNASAQPVSFSSALDNSSYNFTPEEREKILAIADKIADEEDEWEDEDEEDECCQSCDCCDEDEEEDEEDEDEEVVASELCGNCGWFASFCSCKADAKEAGHVELARDVIFNSEIRDALHECISDAVHDAMDEREQEDAEVTEAEVAEEPAEVKLTDNQMFDMNTLSEKTQELTHGMTVWSAATGAGPLRTLAETTYYSKTPLPKIPGESTVKTPTGGTMPGMLCRDRNGNETVYPVADLLPENPKLPELKGKPSRRNLALLGVVTSVAMFAPAFMQYGWQGGVGAAIVAAFVTFMQSREFAKAI